MEWKGGWEGSMGRGMGGGVRKLSEVTMAVQNLHVRREGKCAANNGGKDPTCAEKAAR
jgi:hypothetical protein